MSNIHTISKNMLVKTLQVPAAITATGNSAATVDCLGFDRALIVLQVGTVSGTTPTLNVKLQDSADNSTFADVASATFAQITATQTAPVLMDVDLTKRNRYIQLVNTVAGTTPSFQIQETVILGRAKHLPPTQDNTVVRV